MPTLYELLETNSKNSKNLLTKKVEVLFDLNSEKYNITDTKYIKKFICISGTCNVNLTQNCISETITLNQPNTTIKIDKDISVELSNYIKQTKVYVEYLADKGM